MLLQVGRFPALGMYVQMLGKVMHGMATVYNFIYSCHLLNVFATIILIQLYIILSIPLGGC